jgi:hypothetical protein
MHPSGLWQSQQAISPEKRRREKSPLRSPEFCWFWPLHLLYWLADSLFFLRFSHERLACSDPPAGRPNSTTQPAKTICRITQNT